MREQAETSSAFDRIGGASALCVLIDEFVDRVFDDVMIGFLFRRASKERIKRFEYQHAAEHLGANVRYEGRPIREAHQPHRIMDGHFLRRREILRQVLERGGVPPDVLQEWLRHVDSLRDQVVFGTCDRSDPIRES